MSTQAIIQQLVDYVKIHPEFELLKSLKLAAKAGKDGLDAVLFQALHWPLNLADYTAYLSWFAKWTPKESEDPAWRKPGTDDQQEVYDRLCHFYFLIDQPLDAQGTTLQSNDWFEKWLVAYAQDWGNYLNTTDSFDEAVWQTFLDQSPRYRVQDSLIKHPTTGNHHPNNPSGWKTFNQFFARQLNSGLRPLAEPATNAIISCPADCTYKEQYAISEDGSIPKIVFKKTHKVATVQELLKGSQYADAFGGGVFVHYFLGPYSYHRFHMPVSGTLKECYPVRSLVYLEVRVKDGQFDAPDTSAGGYEFHQARGILTIDTTKSPFGNVGIVAVVPVGMAHVSSVQMTSVPDKDVLKGDEFGYFMFGGSDIIVVFQKGVVESINESTDYHHYGDTIAKCVAQAPK